jgi:hypothetical protein
LGQENQGFVLLLDVKVTEKVLGNWNIQLQMLLCMFGEREWQALPLV